MELVAGLSAKRPLVHIPFTRAATCPLLSTGVLFSHPPAAPRNLPLSDDESGHLRPASFYPRYFHTLEGLRALAIPSHFRPRAGPSFCSPDRYRPYALDFPPRTAEAATCKEVTFYWAIGAATKCQYCKLAKLHLASP